MLAWLASNVVNIVLIAVIAIVCGLVIRSMIRDRKAGKSSCGCDCGSCSGCGQQHRV